MAPQMVRKRLIPNEEVTLANDEIVYLDKSIIVTKWKPIKPRKDIGGGESCYLIDKGIKVSRFYDNTLNFTYWYCDIIDTVYDAEKDKFIFTDLLVDVVVFADGFVKVLDIEELSYALENGLIDQNQLTDALRKLAELLSIVYEGRLYGMCGEYLDMAL